MKIIRNPFVKWGAATILAGVGLLAIGVAIANMVAIPKEKKILLKVESFTAQFPATDFNEPANKIRKLTPKLGFKFFSISEESETKTQFSDEKLNIEVAESDRQAWEEISEPLKNYLNEQFSQPDDSIAPPPKELQDYLSKNAPTIQAIRDIVLNQPSPVWWSNITPIVEGDFSFVLPSYLALINLQKILALDILEKQRQGKTDAAIQMLEVSWKLTEDFQDSPYLIGQLVYLINGRYITGTIRKLDNLPDVWQQRLVDHDYRQSVLTSIQGEFLGHFNGMRNQFGLEPYQLFETVDMFTVEASSNDPQSKNTWFWQLLAPAIESYFRLTAIDLYQGQMEYMEKFQAEEYNVCQSDQVDVEAELAAWWNPLGRIAAPSFVNQVMKGDKYMLDLELTQNILHVKELAVKNGKWPEQVENLESEICPGFTWVYQVDEDGTMSLSLNPEPEWQAERLEQNRGLPLTYRDRTISKTTSQVN